MTTLNLPQFLTDRSAFAAEVATNPRLCTMLMQLCELAMADMARDMRATNTAVVMAQIDTELRIRSEEKV